MRRPIVDNKGRAVSWTFNEVSLSVINTWSYVLSRCCLRQPHIHTDANVKHILSPGEHYPRV